MNSIPKKPNVQKSLGTNSELDIDFNQARQFIDLICDGVTTYQVFSDAGESEEAWHEVSEFEAIKDKLASANLRGLGVYCMINASDGNGRRRENVLSIRALFVDLDGSPIQPLYECAVEPHAIVESSPGRYHGYWLVVNCALDRFRGLQKALAKRFRGDPKVCDLCRVMRLPGFYHRKEEPFQTRIVELNKSQPYDVETIVRELGLNDIGQDDQSTSSHIWDPDNFHDEIPKGNRNNTLFAIACDYVKQGFQSEIVLTKIGKINSACCKPPLPKTEIDSIVESAGRTIANDTDWPTLVPLEIERAAGEPFPIDALPLIIGEAVKEHQRYCKQPMSIVALSALSACSLATQALADVRRDGELKSPLSLYFIIVAQSGERKTVADRAFSAPVRDWERQELINIKPEIEKHKAQLASWNAKREGILSQIKRGKVNSGQPKWGDADSDQFDKNLEQLELDKPPAPLIPRLLFEQITGEALIQDLATGWPSTGLCSDEGGLVIGAHAMGKERAMAFMGLLNRLWDGNSTRSESKNAGRYHIIGRRLTLSLMMQECILSSLLGINNGMARGTGLLARSFICYPESTIGFREYSEPGQMHAMARFNARISELLSIGISVDENGGLVLEPLELSREGRTTWIKYFNDIENESRPNGKYFKIRDFASKNAENVVRLAGVFHVICFGTENKVIDLDILERATKIGRWDLDEAARIFDVFAVPVEMTNAKKLLEWILTRGQPTIDAREISQRGPYSVREKKFRNPALQILVEHGFIKMHKNRITIRPELLTRRM